MSNACFLILVACLWIVSCTVIKCFEGTCYYQGTEKMTYDDAVVYCRETGGVLTSIHSSGEDQFLRNTFVNGWIGFSDAKVEGVWEWEDGSSVDFLNWESGKPDNSRGIQHSAVLAWDYPAWDDQKGAYPMLPICKKIPTMSPTKNPTGNPTPMPTMSPTTKNPTGNPTLMPTMSPTEKPTGNPTPMPTMSPTTKNPTGNPTPMPTMSPTKKPTGNPTPMPTTAPTLYPTLKVNLSSDDGGCADTTRTDGDYFILIGVLVTLIVLSFVLALCVLFLFVKLDRAKKRISSLNVMQQTTPGNNQL